MSDAREESPEDAEPRLEPATPLDDAGPPGEEESLTSTEMPPPEVAETAEEPGRSIEALGDRLSRRLDAIQAILEREARAEANRERVVDRLHAELQEYKQDLLLRVQRPIFVDLIQLHDDIGKMTEARAADEGDADRSAAVRGILESIRVAIEDILYRQGVEPFVAEEETFDPRRQRAVGTVATDDPARAKAIAARLRKGFQAGDKLIRPELVSVYTFRPPPAADPSA